MAEGPGRGAGSRGLPRLPLGLIGAGLLVAVAELAVFRSTPEDVSFIAANWAETGRASAPEEGRCEVLLLGDSQVKCGLQPRLIEWRLGRSAINLALVGGQAASSHHVLDRALRAGTKPRAVVVGFLPALLAADLRINTRNWPELLSPVECLELAVAARDTRLLAPLMAHSLLASYRRRDAVRAAVLARLGDGLAVRSGALDKARTGRDEVRAYRRNWRVNAGAHALPDNPAFRDEVSAPIEDPDAGDRWRCKPENAWFVRKFLRRAESAGVSVFWLLPTTAPALLAAREHDGREAAYRKLVRGFQQEFPGLTVLDPRPALADPSVFSDVCHVDRRGAAVLTLAVAEALEQRLFRARSPNARPAADRWVELAPPGPGVTQLADALLEDVAQSDARLRADALLASPDRLAGSADGPTARR
jgi:hypothetical protein